ncbi:MAG: hypothetical protein ACK5PW_09845 [Burkholderiales bacterium]|jgi:hypothetical protein
MAGIESLLAFDDAINVGANAGVGRVPMVDMLVHWAAVSPAFKFGVLTAALCWIWARGGRDRPQDAAIVIATVLSAFLWPPVRAPLARWILVLRDRAPGPLHAAGLLVLLEVSIMFQDVRTLGATVAEGLRAMN